MEDFVGSQETPIIPCRGEVPSGRPRCQLFLLESQNPRGQPPGHGPFMATWTPLLPLASILAQRKHSALLCYKLWKHRLVLPKLSLLLSHKRLQFLPYFWTRISFQSLSSKLPGGCMLTLLEGFPGLPSNGLSDCAGKHPDASGF